MRIQSSAWFTPAQPAAWSDSGHRPCIGVVVGKDEITGNEKAYIGYGFGISRERDGQYILEHGVPFPLNAAKLLT